MSDSLRNNYKPLIGQSISELEDFLISIGESAYRGRQIFDWIYRKNIYDFNKMTDLSVSLRKKLIEVPIHSLKIIGRNLSNARETQKYLFEFLFKITARRIWSRVSPGMGSVFLIHLTGQKKARKKTVFS